MRHSVLYTLAFSAALCVICAIMVSASAVSLKDAQEANKALDRRLNVLEAAGVIAPGERPPAERVEELFSTFKGVFVDLETGEEVEGGNPDTYDQQKAKKDPATSHAVPENASRVTRVPNKVLVYEVLGDDGKVKTLVLPIEGYGLWGTLYGYLAVAADTSTVVGITYYDHKETPGLGGEVENPRWKALWPGREVYDQEGDVALKVVKGNAGPPSEDPHRVDGLSGATITSRGVTNMIDFWMGSEGFGPYLEHLRQESEPERSAA
jgi:Na+-transporting NADH:ubiquinone oxidoreductase subunit C